MLINVIPYILGIVLCFYYIQDICACFIYIYIYMQNISQWLILELVALGSF